MSRKSNDKYTFPEDEIAVPCDSGQVETIEASAPSVRAPIPGEVYVVNLTRSELDVTLTDGTNLHLGPKTADERHNKSRIVQRKLLLTPQRRNLEKNGSIRVVDAAAEGGN